MKKKGDIDFVYYSAAVRHYAVTMHFDVRLLYPLPNPRPPEFSSLSQV